jgi:hypothetical protein
MTESYFYGKDIQMQADTMEITATPITLSEIQFQQPSTGVNTILDNYSWLTPVATTWTSTSWTAGTGSAVWDYETIGERVFVDLAGLQLAGAGSAAAIIQSGAIIPAALCPSANRIIGPVPVMSNAVILNTGYIIVTTTGVIQIGIGMASASTLTPFPITGGNNGWLATQFHYII